MKPFCYAILVVGLCAGTALGQTSTQKQQPNRTDPTSSNPAASLSVQEYRGILEHERKLLEDQSEKYYARIDKLIDRTLWVLGIIGTAITLLLAVASYLFVSQFGKTRKELKTFVDEHFEKQVASLITTDMNSLKGFVESEVIVLRTSIENVRAGVESLQAFQNQSVVWVLSKTEKEVQEELDALHSTGLRKIQTVTPTKVEELELGEPDLVIFSYDGSEEGRKRLERIVAILKEQSPPVPLLIYTYNPNGNDVRLTDTERDILKDFRWWQPVNFPVTLIAQAQVLVRAKPILSRM
ncbi:MAG TPA: hypothetical protein VJH03_14820 [Blastocatellia bacterium]|nr:hypothetical protein [Blastocatellia bacterium]